MSDLLPSSSVTLLTSRQGKATKKTSEAGQTGSEAAEAGKDKTKKKYPMEKAKRIDVASRFMFPLVFAVFNMAYWSTYLLQAQAEFLKTIT